jgi:hypothetical protein
MLRAAPTALDDGEAETAEVEEGFELAAEADLEMRWEFRAAVETAGERFEAKQDFALKAERQKVEAADIGLRRVHLDQRFANSKALRNTSTRGTSGENPAASKLSKAWTRVPREIGTHTSFISACASDRTILSASPAGVAGAIRRVQAASRR